MQVPWSRTHLGWSIEMVTERVGEEWICRQIRVMHHPKASSPTILILDRSFPSILQALNAGEEHAKRWIEHVEEESTTA